VGFIVLPLYGNQNGRFRGGFRSKPTFGLAAEMWYGDRCAARKRLFFEKWQQLLWPCKAARRIGSRRLAGKLGMGVMMGWPKYVQHRSWLNQSRGGVAICVIFTH
jgi:hypothetical protein